MGGATQETFLLNLHSVKNQTWKRSVFNGEKIISRELKFEDGPEDQNNIISNNDQKNLKSQQFS